ncbi:MAG: bifunctional UDP-N-acetylglucosamine diphosphorylase/glucosamine-1-phosphate N-acetyltransferase GlmU [Hyphomicrobiaceae bacterium]|nr:MAG: bifunctional UDP-N-acetylglucosamine diphosphorylase/glucosamine-1-phosphate N-acetyltransferase GlmU [Hyphomicrobiaceae bacterium]
MAHDPLLIVVLAAGKGTRMKSDLPKVLHRIAGRSMLGHVLALARSAGASGSAVVIGPGQDAVRKEIALFASDAPVFVQAERLGTADAVKAARPAIAAHSGHVIVLFADTPLFSAATISGVRTALSDGAGVVVVGFEAADPAGYGRLLRDAAGRLLAIREHNDASPKERATRLCNGGVMGFRSERFIEIVDAIGNRNAKGEYYLTDAVEIANAKGLACRALICPEEEVLGINSRDQLAEAEAIWQRRARKAAMLAGASMVSPETVWLSHDTVIGRDVTIEPHVFIGPGVTIEDGAEIKAFCHIEGARVGKGARIGPFARLRPGADLGADVHIGNFVEVKNLAVEKGAKANHLAYLGDGRVGEGANIGAGTIFCNYDGFFKHMTDVGKGAFIGSNSSLVAPVKIGEGAYVGSGSVITKDVPPDALALERCKQEERPGWAAKFRALMRARKERAK